MDVICVDEDDEIQQLQKELEELQKEREKYAKELKKRHLRNEIEKLKNENLQLKTKLTAEHASQAHAEKDNDVKPFILPDTSIKKQTGSPGSGQDSKHQNRDCEDNEDNYNTLKENYIWNKNGSPQYLCNLCDFTCEYYIAVYNHLRKKHNKASEDASPKDKPGDKSKNFDSGFRLLGVNISKKLPTKTRSSAQRRASDHSGEERQKSVDSAMRQTFDRSREDIRKSSESAVRHISEERQPSSSSALRRIYDHSREERRKSDIVVRRTSDHFHDERRKSSGSTVRQTSEEKQQSSGSAVRQTSDLLREERQKTSDRETVNKSDESKGPKTNTSIANLFRQITKGYECTVCQEVYNTYTVAYHHVIKQHAEPRYRCKYCAYKVYERHRLIKHCKNEHRGRKLAFIELVNEHQKNKSQAKEDGDSDLIDAAAAAKDTDTGNKDPDDCESDDNNNTEAEDDESEEKSEEEANKSKSGRIVSFKDKILKTSRGFKCGVCGHQTISYQGVYKHYLTNHKEKKEAKFKCSYCTYTTNQRRYCIIHTKKAHKGKPIIYRTVGGAQKTHKTVVGAHKSQQLTMTDYISRTAKGFKCTVCGTKAEEYQKARYHVYYQHFAVFVCPYCEYKSSKRPQVVTHARKLHPGKPLKITWHVKGKTRKNKESIKVGDEHENRKKNNSSGETGNKRNIGRPRKRLLSPDVAKENLPEIKIEQGYMSISMNSKRVKLLPCQDVIKDIKPQLDNGVSIKVEPNDPEQSDVRLLPNVYIDKDELYEFVPQVNEPVTDGPHVEQEIPISSSTTLVEEDPVPVSSTTVDVTPDEVDGAREEEGEEDHPAEKSDIEKGNTAESGELDLDMEVEYVEMENGKKTSDSKHESTEKKKDDGEDSDDILSPRMCMHIDQNEVWEIRVDELQGQSGVQSEIPPAKIKVEKEEEEAAGI